MTNSRRNFCRNSVLFGLGLSFFPLLTEANSSLSQSTLCLKKRAQRVVKVRGKICFANLNPVKNANLEIWHNNSEKNASIFDYKGKLITDSEGFYEFETDFPDKHFEDGNYRMRRIFFKIKEKNTQETITKLYFGENGKAFIDNQHFESTQNDFREQLPKTKHESENLIIVQFNIFLNL
jgi:protocatechuate 3,4-dioxygenase beta subunit